MRRRVGLVPRAVRWNSDRVRAADPETQNPRPLDGIGWHSGLVAAWSDLRGEWDEFSRSGGRLPRTDDLLGESQGNSGTWRAGLLVSRGRPIDPLARAFPATISALAGVPGLRSALWSVLEPGAVLPPHEGPNAGVLRYHLGVSCPAGAALLVGSTVTEFRDRQAVLFDDTEVHEAWNSGGTDRVTLFCEVLRPVSKRSIAMENRTVQCILSLDRRYRDAPLRAAAWHSALNRGRFR